MGRLRQLRADEAGFTLPELLTAMSIGVVVVLAGLMVLDRSVAGSDKIAARQDAVQRGRLAMELVTRDLRSQVCLGDGRPILAGDDNGVTFYANLSSNPDAADKRQLRYIPGEKRLYEEIYPGSGVYPSLSFSTTPAETREVLRPVVPVVDAGVPRPMFRYYRYRPGGSPGELERLATPLSTADAPDVVMVRVAFVALPTRRVERDSDARDATTFESDIYTRLADPTQPDEGPRCL